MSYGEKDMRVERATRELTKVFRKVIVVLPNARERVVGSDEAKSFVYLTLYEVLWVKITVFEADFVLF